MFYDDDNGFDPTKYNFHDLPSEIKECWSEDPVLAKAWEFKWRTENDVWTEK